MFEQKVYHGTLLKQSLTHAEQYLGSPNQSQGRADVLLR
jgi:hypothetical protein